MLVIALFLHYFLLSEAVNWDLMLENVEFYSNIRSTPIHIICPLLEMKGGLCFILFKFVSCETLSFSEYKTTRSGPRVQFLTHFAYRLLLLALLYANFKHFSVNFIKNTVLFLCCTITILCWFEVLSSRASEVRLLSFCLCLHYGVVHKL